MNEASKVLKPLSCSIDATGEKRSRFNAEELRDYLKENDDKVIFVVTDDGVTVPIVVGPLRACLGMSA